MRKTDLLKSALEIVEKRGLNYGTPENNFDRIANLWTIYLTMRDTPAIGSGCEVNGADVAAMMILMKVARLMEKPDHLDSWLDIAGYAACGAEVSRAGDPPTVHEFFDEADMEHLYGAALDHNEKQRSANAFFDELIRAEEARMDEHEIGFTKEEHDAIIAAAKAEDDGA